MVGVAGVFFLGANLAASQVQSAQELSSRGLAQTPVPYENQLVERTQVTQSLAPVYEDHAQQEVKVKKTKKSDCSSCCRRSCTFCKKHPYLGMCGMCILLGGIVYCVNALMSSGSTTAQAEQANQFASKAVMSLEEASRYISKSDLAKLPRTVVPGGNEIEPEDL